MYSYLESMKNDIREAIEYDYDIEEYRGNRRELEDKLNDDFWADDSITGNGCSGEYASSIEEAKSYVMDNIPLLIYAMRDFCVDYDAVGKRFMEEDWHYFDASIRCWMLGQAISEVLDEIGDSGIWDDEPAEDEDE